MFTQMWKLQGYEDGKSPIDKKKKKRDKRKAR